MVKEQIENMGSQVGEMNQRMKELETSVEAIKGYLRDLREATVGWETGDRGKAFMGQEPSPSYLLLEKETTVPQTERSEGRIAEREATSDERKVEDLPVFERDDTINWIFKVERYFEVNHLTEREKLIVVGVCMEGRTLSWFKWRVKRQSFSRWVEFQNEY